jgi:hypothetical protein
MHIFTIKRVDRPELRTSKFVIRLAPGAFSTDRAQNLASSEDSSVYQHEYQRSIPVGEIPMRSAEGARQLEDVCRNNRALRLAIEDVMSAVVHAELENFGQRNRELVVR